MSDAKYWDMNQDFFKSTGIVPPPEDELAVVTQEWVDMFERAHLALRLSPMLRERYGD